MNTAARHLLLAAACLLAVAGLLTQPLTLQAAEVTEAQARRLAAQHFAARQQVGGSTAPQALSLVRTGWAGSKDGDGSTLFIYNSDEPGGGFVIVAGDDRLDGILGYSDTGHFDPDDVPPPVAYWLSCYEAQIGLVRRGKAEPYRAATIYDAISPLVRTKWDQTAPYNLQAPEYEQGQHSATGCVATAMAQLLRYYAYNHATTPIPAYVSATLELTMPQLPATTFNYALMKDSYDATDTGSSAQEVARLMKYCGQAARMDYGPSSGSQLSPSYLSDYFGYNPNSLALRRVSYTAAQWDQLFYDELRQGHPLILSGLSFDANGSAGHAFLVDGYRDGLFHINWGWGGFMDGYFKLSECNPNGRGVGGSTSSDGYSMDQRVLVHLHPQQTASAALLTTTNIYTYNAQHDYVRTATDQNFSFTAFCTMYNMTAATHSFEMAFGLYRDDQLVAVYPEPTATGSYPSVFGTTIYRTFQWGAGISEGFYQLRGLCRLSGTTVWQRTMDSNRYCLNLTVSGNKLKVERAVEQLQVNSVCFAGTPKVNNSITMTANITNTGTVAYANLYLFIDGRAATGVGVHIDPGETEDVLLHFAPPTAGTVALGLYTSVTGSGSNTRPASGTLVWGGTMAVGQRTDPDVTMVGFHLDDAYRDEATNSMCIAGTAFRMTTRVTNNADETFDDDLVVYLYENTDGGNTFHFYDDVQTHAVIAPGATEEVHFNFENLTVGARYLAVMRAYYTDGLRELDDTQTMPFRIMGGASAVAPPVAAKAQPAPDVYDLSGRRVATAGRTSLLAPGVYLVGGRKMVVRR